MKGLYKISGIYKIQSILKNERYYIGSATNIGKRWSRHLNDLRKNKHGNIKLQNHYNKYGESDLQYSILLGSEISDLVKTEQYFIDTYNPWFNICPIANSVHGRKCSDETKRKMSLKHKGKKLSEEHKKNMSKARKGINYNPPRTEESKRLFSEKMKGHFTSEETKKKIGLANKGRKQTIEQKEKLRLLHLGKKQSPETIAKRIKSCTGRIRTEEYKQRMRIISLNNGSRPPSRLGCANKKVS